MNTMKFDFDAAVVAAMLAFAQEILREQNGKEPRLREVIQKAAVRASRLGHRYDENKKVQTAATRRELVALLKSKKVITRLGGGYRQFYAG